MHNPDPSPQCTFPTSLFLACTDACCNSSPGTVFCTCFWCVSHSSQLCTISKIPESAFCPFIQVTDEDVKQDQTQYQSLGNAVSYTPSTRLCSTDHNPLSSAGQLVLNPPHCPLIYPTLPKLTCRDIMGGSVERLAEVKVQNIHSLIYP